MTLRSFILAAALLFSIAGRSWCITAEAAISAQEAGVGEAISLTVTVTDDKENKDLPWPEIQGNLEAFTITKNQGTSSSSQTTIINGRVSRQTNYITTFTYQLTAAKPGTYTIGPIVYAHEKFRRNLGSASVRIVKVEPGVQLQTTLSESKAYIGEQVRYNLRIIPNASVQNIQAPDFKKSIGESFWMKELDQDIKAKVVTIDGEQKKIYDVRFALFPLIKGTVTLPGFPVDYEELVGNRQRNRSVFDMFGGGVFGSRVKKQAQTREVSIQVRPLPEGAPSGFSGAVGRYSLKASVDRSEVPSGEAITLKVEISGDGQPKAITKPVMPDLTGFEVYQPEVKSSTEVKGGTLFSFTVFKYVLIPVNKGTYEIGPVRFPYFDPASGAYKTAASQPIQISVSQGKEVEHSGVGIRSQRAIEQFGEDIRHLKAVLAQELKADNFIYRSTWFWLLFAAAPLMYFILLFYRNRTKKLEGDEGLRRKVKARSFALKRLSEARKALKGSDTAVFYRSLVQAVERFASDRMNMELRGMTIGQAVEALQQKNISVDIVNSYRDLMERCDMGQFARPAKDAAQWEKAFGDAEQLINRLNKGLR